MFAAMMDGIKEESVGYPSTSRSGRAHACREAEVAERSWRCRVRPLPRDRRSLRIVAKGLRG
jgi:hypothetical protein